MRLHALLPALALLAAPALAQDRSFTGGFQAGLLKFTGSSDLNTTGTATIAAKDMVDDKVGFTIGGHVAWDFGGGQMLRVRLDESYTTGSTTPDLGSGIDTKVYNLALMGEYVFHVTGNREGFYVAAGLGYEHTIVKADSGFLGSDDSSKGAFAWSAGLGWQFTSLVGMDLRYVSSHPSGMTIYGNDFDFKNDRIAVGVSFSF